MRNAPRGSDMQKLGDLYSSYMDSAAIEAAGVNPVRPDLRASTPPPAAPLPPLFASLAKIVVGRPSRGRGAGPQGVGPLHVQARQGGLGLPDRDYYLSQDARLAATRTAYVTYMTTLLTWPATRPCRSAQRVLALETELRSASGTAAQPRPQRTYNKMTVAELRGSHPGYDWARHFAAMGINTPEVIVGQPSYYAGADSVLAAAPVADVKAYMAVRLLDNSAPFLSSPFANANFEFRGRALSGQQVQRERWKRGVALAEGGLGQMLGKVYVERSFPAESKVAMTRLVQNLLAAFRAGIDELAWMSPPPSAGQGQAGAHHRQDRLPALAGLLGAPGDARQPVRHPARHGRLRVHRGVSRLGRPVDRTEWGMTPRR